MQQSVYQDLESLLEHTRALIACAEPSLPAWQDYTERRSQLFQRCQELLTQEGDRVADAKALHHLVASVLEQDQVLLAKVRQHLSKISREMSELADRRRLFNAYVVPAHSALAGYLHTA